MPLPPSLILLHEDSDDYSLECTEPVTLDAFNATDFINEYGRKLNKEQLDEEFPYTI
ncbi:hypothetical protein K466DRAFT_605520 [Polyporus arcularius HHB13444]|uniref:Tse2 ADP-ribosyltransferase toxin domain-containing protein n=1 Tax=Polyporus arcularius HHB13444 TaxID=1314778 RepID=A0A5C3NSB6_9APHY|nr:hypothetical protein K466DRAFT_605520 [Polyporus arcularius HHB13444]